MNTERTMHKVNPVQIKGNDLMAFITYAKVKAVDADGLRLLVNDINGKEISIKGKDLIEGSFSADQYQEEQKVSKTQAAEILISSHNRPITVCFLKKDEKEPTGEKERVLRGRLIAPEPLLGRSMMEDLDIDDGKSNVRLVDHRSLQWLVTDGVKYIVK